MADVTIAGLSPRTSLAADDVFEVDNGSTSDDSESATFALMGGLEIVHRDTDAVHTFVVGEHYISDISAWSNAGSGRVWTLPTTHAVGERCAVTLEVGDATEHLAVNTGVGNTCIFKDSTISASSEITRIFITGETVVFKSVTANSIWELEFDGRVPQKGRRETHGTNTQSIGMDAQVKLTDSGPLEVEAFATGTVWNSTDDEWEIRRDGKYFVSGVVGMNQGTPNGIDNEDIATAFIYINTTQTLSGPQNHANGSTTQFVCAVAGVLELSAGDGVRLQVYVNDGATAASNFTTVTAIAKNNLSIAELL